MKISFDQIKPHLISIGIIILLIAIYFSPSLSGKVIPKQDIISYQGAVKEKKDFEKQEHRTILWTNSMFGGMPTYQISTLTDGNLVVKLNRVTNLFSKGPIGRFFCAMICMYIFLCVIGVNHWLSLIGAIGFGFTTNNMILWEAGHSTKLSSLCYLSLITSGMVLLFKRKLLLGSILFSVGLSLNLAVNHVQMTYYFAMCLVIYWIIQCVLLLKEKDIKTFFKLNGTLLVCSVLAILTTSTNYLSTYEYQEDTMRGKAILASNDSSDVESSSSVTNGLDWDYAMQWSNGADDVLASIIPGIVGGGSSGTNSMVKKGSDLAKMGVPVGQNAYTYSGELPFTSGPAYFGAILCFLFVLGIIIVKGPTKWWLLSSVIFTILVSMGKHFPFLNELLFNHLPLFNKFRSHNSVLGVTAFFVATLGILALAEIIKKNTSKEKSLKGIKIAGIITAGFCLLVAILGDGIIPIDAPMDADVLKQTKNNTAYLDAIHSNRISVMKSDAWRSLIFIGLGFTAIFLFIRGKLKETVLIVTLGSLILFDLWGVNKRYINHDSFKKETKNPIVARAVDQQILMDTDLSYRVLDLSVKTFNNSTSSYFHKTIGGYSAAKLQRYQDIIEYHISKNNTEVFNMLNTKYIIDREQKAQQNPLALGNAWFVENIRKVSTPNDEIESLDDIKVDSTAIVLDEEFGNYIGNFNPDKNGSIRLTKYVPDRLEYESNSTSEQFAVFSEVWYGPNKGWEAYVDGKLVPYVRTNYLLRGMKVPAGKHKIEFKFKPKSFALGKTMALISSLLIFSLILFGLYTVNKETGKKALEE